MRHRRSARSVEADSLQALKRVGAASAVLDARLAYMRSEGLARYARQMCDEAGGVVKRVFCTMLPTAQVSGRTSTTDPPLVNFPTRDGYSVAWGMIRPDPGWPWLHFDLDALHSRIACCYTGDQDDLEAFRRGDDLHLVTACGMWRVPLPPDDLRSKAVHDSSDPRAVAWRALWTPSWEGEKDRRRRLAKVMRYALLLGINEKAVLDSHEVEELGLSREETLTFARLYLRSKPQTVQGKQRIFLQVAREGKARSFRGRLRRLYGDDRQRAKDGWSHILQGGEQDIMDEIKRAVWQEFPETRLVLDTHDGLTLAHPESLCSIEAYHESIKPLVEQTWEINGVHIHIPASWGVIKA